MVAIHNLFYKEAIHILLSVVYTAFPNKSEEIAKLANEVKGLKVDENLRIIDLNEKEGEIILKELKKEITARYGKGPFAFLEMFLKEPKNRELRKILLEN